MLDEIPILDTEHAGVCKVFEFCIWGLAPANSCVDHVDSDLHFTKVKGRAYMAD
jgi:hypothetical protein